MGDNGSGGTSDYQDNRQKDAVLALKNEGNSYYKQGLYGKALDCYTRALEGDPDNTDVWNNTAMALGKLGKTAEAKECQNRISEIMNRGKAWPETTPELESPLMAPQISHLQSPSHYCQKCGNKLTYEGEPVCHTCGFRMKTSLVSGALPKPWLATFFSFFVPGWGQWYNGRTKDGLQFFGVYFGSVFLATVFFGIFPPLAVVLIPILLGAWIYGMVDAFTTAVRINSRGLEFNGKSGFFWLPLVLVVLLVLVIVFAALAMVL